jgi:hypothetical protein
MRRRWEIAWLAGIVLVACSSGSRSDDGTLEPPPDTGLVAADLDGWWAVTDIARLDSAAELPFADPGALPFLSVQEGQTVSISAGRAYDLQGSLLHAEWYPGVPNRSYTNLADDRFWLFESEFVNTEECVFDVSIRAAFGTVDANTLEGFVDVRFFTSCPQPAVVRPNPNGLYAVHMHRVAADGEALRTGR